MPRPKRTDPIKEKHLRLNKQVAQVLEAMAKKTTTRKKRTVSQVVEDLVRERAKAKGEP